MEEMHRNHKEPTWGWLATLDGWRRSRTRRRIRGSQRLARSREF